MLFIFLFLFVFVFVCEQLGLEGAKNLQIFCFFILINTLEKIFICKKTLQNSNSQSPAQFFFSSLFKAFSVALLFLSSSIFFE